jgi:hypothetical protein
METSFDTWDKWEAEFGACRLPHYHVVWRRNTTDETPLIGYSNPFAEDRARGFIDGVCTSKPTRRRGDINTMWLVECHLRHNGRPYSDDERAFLDNIFSREPVWKWSA